MANPTSAAATTAAATAATTTTTRAAQTRRPSCRTSPTSPSSRARPAEQSSACGCYSGGESREMLSSRCDSVCVCVCMSRPWLSVAHEFRKRSGSRYQSSECFLYNDVVEKNRFALFFTLLLIKN